VGSVTVPDSDDNPCDRPKPATQAPKKTIFLIRFDIFSSLKRLRCEQWGRLQPAADFSPPWQRHAQVHQVRGKAKSQQGEGTLGLGGQHRIEAMKRDRKSVREFKDSRCKDIVILSNCGPSEEAGSHGREAHVR
jgi:hypothetical protein